MSRPGQGGPSRALVDDPAALAWLREHVGGMPTAYESVQRLWSGYGEIVRVRLDGAAVPSVIVKRVEPPPVDAVAHPRGFGGSASHRRKLRSYEVERRFYAEVAPAPVDSHRTAACHAAEATPGGWRFLLEDLDAAGYADRWRSRDRARLEACLGWLAAFHARFLGRAPAGLWPSGTYWHLATRADELAATADRELRDAAPALDAALHGCRFRTLVHGDAKVANFCFGSRGVAAVDFQYVGGGCGVQDVAYLLSSALSDAECEAEAERFLGVYFRALRERLHESLDGAALEAEWRALYPAAWADFHRFLAGWAPDHWKIHAYTRRMTRLALARLP